MHVISCYNVFIEEGKAAPCPFYRIKGVGAAMKAKRILLYLALLAIIVSVIAGRKYFYDLYTYRKTIANITIGEVELSKIPDGVYAGSSDANWVAANVRVTVEKHRITKIDLDHHHDRGIDAEVIPERVIEAQSLQVDIVSGATSSSKVILDAIENAFRSRTQ